MEQIAIEGGWRDPAIREDDELHRVRSRRIRIEGEVQIDQLGRDLDGSSIS